MIWEQPDRERVEDPDTMPWSAVVAWHEPSGKLDLLGPFPFADDADAKAQKLRADGWIAHVRHLVPSGAFAAFRLAARGLDQCVDMLSELEDERYDLLEPVEAAGSHTSLVAGWADEAKEAYEALTGEEP